MLSISDPRAVSHVYRPRCHRRGTYVAERRPFSDADTSARSERSGDVHYPAADRASNERFDIDLWTAEGPKLEMSMLIWNAISCFGACMSSFSRGNVVHTFGAVVLYSETRPYHTGRLCRGRRRRAPVRAKSPNQLGGARILRLASAAASGTAEHVRFAESTPTTMH